MDLVGRYQLQEKIGEGAMADVWRAHDPGIDRVLAVKILKPEYRKDAECSGRFLREARAAGALSHPGIVTIYDVGEVDGFPYIAMELLDGEPLDQVVQRGRLTIESVTAIGIQLAQALAYAHGLGVIHRDIKPSNIMLLRDGRSIKILDFGIARVTEAGSATESSHLRTQIGQVLGTPRYMSPEQALGRELDGRSDLFSTGVVLYELITGQHAFNGASAATLALQITQSEPPPIAGLAPDCPRGLQFIIGKLMAKRPEKRFADGGDLVKALQREQSAQAALAAEAKGRRGYLPLQARITLLMTSITAVALLASIGTVLNRQYAAMQRMALTSGSSIAAFVANNAAMSAADNAALPPEQRDWLPVQAFVAAASTDANVRGMTVVDADGVIRGASNPALIGSRYAAPSGEKVVERGANVVVTATGTGDTAGFRFVHPITYSGRSFGAVDVRLGKSDLESAARLSRMLLTGLGVLILFVVMMVSYAAARGVASPVIRLKAALRDAARGNLDFRISHHRKDEFGALFDGFNLLTNAVQERLEEAESRPNGRPEAVDATRIGAPPSVPPVAGEFPFARRSA